MQLIPAIDLRDGKCVRLWQGDYAQETIYAEDPVEVARSWEQAGAEWLHLVDLDGAKAGSGRNLPTVRAIAESVSIPLELGGGLRDDAALAAAFAAGVERAIVGTAALQDDAFVARAVAAYGERFAVGIDARDGLVAVRGWRETSSVPALVLARRMAELGVRRLIYTDIARDGTLSGPNFAAMAEMVLAVPVPVIASGGVATLADLLRLVEVGVEGAIVGRALYTGHLDLAQALQALAAKVSQNAD